VCFLFIYTTGGFQSSDPSDLNVFITEIQHNSKFAVQKASRKWKNEGNKTSQKQACLIKIRKNNNWKIMNKLPVGDVCVVKMEVYTTRFNALIIFDAPHQSELLIGA